VLTELVDACDLFVAIDSFLPHLAHLRKKRGVVLWGPSDPKIYGYPEHVHLHAVPSRFRPDQFGRWEGHPADPVAFADPVKVSQVINIIFNTEEEICDVR
jgi:ADP-heptose:LPS heptosyltransferase